MRQVKNYRFSPDLWGIGLFFTVMLPNFIWFAFPAQNDVLRQESVTPILDSIAQACQIVMAASLCAVVNTTRERPMKRRYAAGAAACVVLYFAGWAAYYAGCANAAVILGLCLTPCGAFLLFSLGRKNAPALLAAAGFTACHLISTLVNFILEPV